VNKSLCFRLGGLVLIVAGLIFLGVKYTVPLTRLVSDAGKFGNYLQSFGTLGVMVFVLIQSVQVVIAPIPGELTQFAGGYIYGTWLGTLYSMAGILLGSMVVFALGRGLGFPLLRLFISEKVLQKFNFLINHPKTELVILVLFLIPGSPKDMLTYIAGLTPVKPVRFFVTAMVARFPGILLSSFIGAHVEEKQYGAVIVASVVALGLFVIGVLLQDRVTRMFKHRHHSP
jgi:uncharacterized membrane protein YdjX (TVP38/TMEM64 family)